MRLIIGIAFCLICTTPVLACSVDTQAVVFGNVDVTRSTTANGRITVDCPAAAVFAISIGSGHEGADRIMGGPNGAQLRYRLYVDAGFIQLWGDGGVTGPSVGGNVEAGSSTEYTVFGVVPEQSPVPAGAYADLPIITLLY